MEQVGFEPTSRCTRHRAAAPYVLVGRVGIEPTVFLMCLIYSQVSSPSRHTDPYLAPHTGFEPATPSGHGFQDRFLTTRTHGIWRRRRDLNSRTGYPAYSLSRGAPSASWVLRHMYERRTLTWYTFAHPATSKYRSLVGMVVLETTTYRLSGDHSNHLSYIPVYEKLLTLIIQWT